MRALVPLEPAGQASVRTRAAPGTEDYSAKDYKDYTLPRVFAPHAARQGARQLFGEGFATARGRMKQGGERHGSGSIGKLSI